MKTAARRRLAGLALIVLSVAVPAAAARADDTAGAELGRFNQAMRDIYADSRARLLAETRPIIVVGFDELTLMRDSGSESAPYTPALYHKLKSVSHVVLGMIGAVTPWPRPGDNATRWRDSFATIRERSAALAARLEGLDLDAETTARQARILDATTRYIDGALARGTPDRDAFAAYLAAIKPDWLANAGDAARAQLEAMHAVVSRWRETLSPAAWERLRVVVLGPRMPRAGNLQTAYFARLLGDDAVGTRIIYAENVFTSEPALDLMGVIVMDRHLSGLVFGDRMRMDRDLLGNAAATILDALIPAR